jgi:hypothetical protein
MQVITWRDVFDESSSITGRLYVLRDGAGVILYIGQSSDVGERLLSHVGRGAWLGFMVSRVGRFVLDHMPAALDWQIETYDLAELQAVYAAYWLPEHVVDAAEEALIRAHEPHFNVLTNRRNPAADVEAPRVANAGVILGDDW